MLPSSLMTVHSFFCCLLSTAGSDSCHTLYNPFVTSKQSCPETELEELVFRLWKGIYTVVGKGKYTEPDDYT